MFNPWDYFWYSNALFLICFKIFVSPNNCLWGSLVSKRNKKGYRRCLQCPCHPARLHRLILCTRESYCRFPSTITKGKACFPQAVTGLDAWLSLHTVAKLHTAGWARALQRSLHCDKASFFRHSHLPSAPSTAAWLISASQVVPSPISLP